MVLLQLKPDFKGSNRVTGASCMILLFQGFNTFSPVLTLVIQQSMLHNTSSCAFWNTQAAGTGHVSTVSHKQGVCVCVKTKRQTAQAQSLTTSNRTLHLDM